MTDQKPGADTAASRTDAERKALTLAPMSRTMQFFSMTIFFVLGLITAAFLVANPFDLRLLPQRSAQEAAAELGATEAEFLGPTADNSVAGQIEIVTNAATQGVDAVMISNNAGDQIVFGHTADIFHAHRANDDLAAGFYETAQHLLERFSTGVFLFR